MPAPRPSLFMLEVDTDYWTGEDLEPRTVRFHSAREWNGLLSDPAKSHIGLSERLSYSITIDHPFLNGGNQSQSGTRFGTVTIDIDKSRDALVVPPYLWEGRALRLKRAELPAGFKLPSLSDFDVVFSGVVQSVARDLEVVQIAVRDKMHLLETKRIQKNVYQGTGGAEGTEDLKDTPKPVLLGTCYNVEPVLIDPANNIYQINDGTVSLLEVRDDGVPFDYSGTDVADYASLVAWVPEAGKYATSAASGLFRLGNKPDGRVTCSASGGSTFAWNELIAKLAVEFGGLDPSEIGPGGSNTTERDASIQPGLYTGTTPMMIAEGIRQMAEAGFGWAVFDGDGILQIGTFDLSTKTSSGVIRASQIDEISFQHTPPPPKLLRIGYRRSWTVQTDVRDGAPDLFRSFASQEYRYVEVAGPSTLYPESPPVTVNTIANAASTLATVVSEWLSGVVGWQRARIVCRGQALRRSVGELITIQHPRLGLSSGVDAMILGVHEDLSVDDLGTTLDVMFVWK